MTLKMCLLNLLLCITATSLLLDAHNISTSTQIDPCEVNVFFEDVRLNCSSRSLTFINKSWFPENTTELMLQSNQLTVIPNNTLNHLYKLERLSLQDNALTYIEPNAFQGLNNLQYLNLENLDLFRLSVDIFSDLISLTELRLIQKQNDQQCVKTFLYDTNSSFPDQMFSHLKNLKTLSVSIFKPTLYFNDDFSKLMKLNTLHITGSVQIIDENSFKHIKHIQHLEMSTLHQMSNFSDLAFESFNDLKHITLTETLFGLHNALNTLRPLVNTNLTTLYFQEVQTTPGLEYISITTQDGILDEASTKYLRQICISEIHLIRCAIFLIHTGAFTSPITNRCLKSLYLMDNPLLGTFFGVQNLLKLQTLNTLVITGFYVRKNGLDDYSNFLKKNRSNYLAHLQELKYKSNESLLLASSDSVLSSMELQSNDIIVVFSKSLEFVEISSVIRKTYINKKYRLQGGENLKHIRLLDDGFRFVEFPIEGLENLKIFEFSYNKLYSLSADFFNSYISLEELSIDNCRLRNDFMSVYSAHLFKNLTKLQQLDISYNDLEILAPKTFLTNKNLTSLNIAGNRFKEIPFDLNLTPELQILDIRKNIFTTISETDRKTIEAMKDRLGNFQLFLSGNIFSCGCDNLPFLVWLQTTNIQLDENRNFTCINDKSSLSYTLAYENLEGLWRECWGIFFFNFSIAMLCFTLIGFLLVFIWSKNKTLIVSWIMQMFTDFKLKKLTDYKYGAFIGYSDIDYQFACVTLRKFIEDELELSTFILDRDLLPSTAIAEGIIDGINSSWRVILVINYDFLNQNDWFLFTIRSAVYSMNPANPSRVVILVEDKNLNKLPNELMSSVPEDNIIVVSRWEMTYELKQFLKTRSL